MARWACSVRPPLHDERARRRPDGATRSGGSPPRGRREVPLDLGDDGVVVERAGGGHHHRRRAVPAVEELADVVGVMATTVVALAGRLPPERVVGEQRLVDERVDPVVVGCPRRGCSSSRMTWRSLSTSSSRSAGAVSTSPRISRPEVEGAGRQARVVGGVLLRGEGVHVAADAVDRLGDVAGACGPRCP